MSRCKHQSCRIHEEASTWLQFTFEDGEQVDDYAPDATPTGRYQIECQDCGKTFHCTVRTMPKWAKTLMKMGGAE